MMYEQCSIPNAETRKRIIKHLRASNRQLEEASLALDELIALVDADLRQQRRKRLQQICQ